MEKKPINEIIMDERDRQIDRKASQNARIAERYVTAFIVIVSFICKQRFVGWIALSASCISEIVETVTKYYHYRENSYLKKAALWAILLISAVFLAISEMIQR